MATAVELPKINLDLPRKFQGLFVPKRYKVRYGGRGSSKSWSVARALLSLAYWKPLRVLCARELQNSISESVHRLLCDQIDLLGLAPFYEIQQQGIYRRPHQHELDAGITRGSEFFFYGIRSNPTKVKSAEGIDIVWVEEAEKVSKDSWEILIPTIRTPNSEIWITFNPDEEMDPTYQRFVVKPPPNCDSVEVNWHDNHWFPEILRQEKDYLAKVDPEAYEHVWNGRCRKNASSQIFRGKYVIGTFEPPDPQYTIPMWEGPYFGMDHGFSQDPAVFTKVWVDTEKRRLMIEYEAWAIGCELDDLPQLAKTIPGIDERVIRADPSRPETISHVARKGALRIESAEAWKGSVEDGIAWLKSFTQIVIHPRCRHAVDEARLYSYKVDRLTGDVLTDMVDKNNHVWDAVRYACEPMIMAGTNIGIWSRL